MGILLFLTLLVGVGIGIGLAVTGGFVSSFGSSHRKDLVLARKNLNIAESALRRIASGTSGKPELEADIALDETNKNTTNYLEGRK